jgi:uncharacterized glyoxalase superfamily protein PhnB
MTPDAVSSVLHGTLEVSPSCKIMASDSLDKSVVFGDNIAMSLNFGTDTQISTAYEKLSEDGSVFHALADQFWGGEVGSLGSMPEAKSKGVLTVIR